MKLSAYIIIALWVAALFGTIYFVHMATQDARSELLGMVFRDGSTRYASAPLPETRFATQTASPSEDALRGQLADGLASLKTSLEGYSIRLAQAGTGGTAPATVAN